LFLFQVALITFLYVDFLDATGTFYSMANFLGNYVSRTHSRSCAYMPAP
jgi:xanthine/uracil/vitamin C permease (AzgA family)